MRRICLFSLSIFLLAALFAAPAFACGGCFSPASPTAEQIVRQNAERVLFVRDGTTSIVWVEVRYTGLAKEFGWVLPVPKLPKVGVGSASVFDGLDAQLGARYVGSSGPAENCRDPWDGCDADKSQHYYGSADSASDASLSAADAFGGGNATPSVQVLASGQTGPYDYVVVDSTDAKPLLDWLNAHGYATPDKALPILASHIKKGNKFVAIKLQNGQGIEAIRPVTLLMDDAEPCVPLRLTSIAAEDDMTVAVTIAGPGRAIVKNHFDVEVNPLRLVLLNSPGGVPTNYAQVLAAAIDEAGGHAFVTEASLSGLPGGQLSPLQGFQTAGWSGVQNLRQLAEELFLLPLNDEVAAALDKHLNLQKTWPNIAVLQMLADLKACAQYWSQGMASPDCVLPDVTLNSAQLQAMPVDGVALADEITTTLVQPIVDMAKLLGKQPRLTRLVMRISPAEMDRDPVFAFHNNLPLVQPVRTFASNTVCPTGWSGFGQPTATRLSIDGLGTWVLGGDKSIIDPLFLKAPAALRIRLQDENVAPVDIDPAQISLVDQAILGAVPGTPSLPAGMTLKVASQWTPPASQPLLTTVGPWPMPAYGCVPKTGWLDGQVPPKGTSTPGPDAGVTDSNGTVPGVDAAGGWQDVVAAKDVAQAKASTATAKSGCTAGRSAGQGWLPLVSLAVALVLRRRLRARRSA